MTIGQFRDRLTIQQATVTLSVLGSPLEAWGDAFHIWARPVTRNERLEYSDGQEFAPVLAEWELRYDSRLTTTLGTARYRLVLNNQVYDVEQVLRDGPYSWRLTARHRGTLTATEFMRYAGISADNQIASAELTVSSAVSEITVPTFTSNQYLAFAVPDDQPDIDSLEVAGSGLNQIAAFERQPGTVDLNGVAVKVWRSVTVVFPINSGIVWEIGLA